MLVDDVSKNVDDAMHTLRTIDDRDIFLCACDVSHFGYRKRQAARAVVFDSDRKIAILHVAKKGYHKLPGGGIEEGEDIPGALMREMHEEIGCEIEVIGEIGCIDEYRHQHDFHQRSCCYLAKTIGEKSRPQFTEEEIDNGFGVLWVDPDKAIEILKSDRTEDYVGKFILARDLIFLEHIGIGMGRQITRQSIGG